MEELSLPVALALGFGWLLKNVVFKNRAEKLNQLIPVINFAALFIGRLLFEVQPAEAGVFGFLGGLGKGVAEMAYQSAVEAVIASGAQSSAKATGRAALKLLKLALLDKLIGAAEKEAVK